MSPLSIIPWYWKAGAALVLVASLAAGLRIYGAMQYSAGHKAAVSERAASDAVAMLKRVRDNAALAARQDATNTAITKEKDEEIDDLRRRLAAAPRLRIGPSICPDRPAATAQAESPASSDGPNPPARMVSSRADTDFKQLIAEVEADLATGRACQAFVRENGLAP